MKDLKDLETTTAAHRGDLTYVNTKLQGNNIMNSAKHQRLQALKWLQEKPLTTLEARQELFIMSIAARIFELKESGYNIVTHKVKAGSRMIAQYVLLAGGQA